MIECIDYGGNDIPRAAILRKNSAASAIPRRRSFERLMQEGRIGLKSGQSFYDYRDGEAQPEAVARGLVELFGARYPFFDHARRLVLLVAELTE